MPVLASEVASHGFMISEWFAAFANHSSSNFFGKCSESCYIYQARYLVPVRSRLIAVTGWGHVVYDFIKASSLLFSVLFTTIEWLRGQEVVEDFGSIRVLGILGLGAFTLYHGTRALRWMKEKYASNYDTSIDNVVKAVSKKAFNELPPLAPVIFTKVFLYMASGAAIPETLVRDVDVDWTFGKTNPTDPDLKQMVEKLRPIATAEFGEDYAMRKNKMEFLSKYAVKMGEYYAKVNRNVNLTLTKHVDGEKGSSFQEGIKFFLNEFGMEKRQ